MYPSKKIKNPPVQVSDQNSLQEHTSCLHTHQLSLVVHPIQLIKLLLLEKQYVHCVCLSAYLLSYFFL